MAEHSNTAPVDASDLVAIRRARLKVLILVLWVGALLTWQCWPALVWLGRSSVSDSADRRPFESDKWKQKASISADVRLHMVEDLLEKHVLVGMTEAEIVDLLGAPDGVSSNVTFAVVWPYVLGAEPYSFGDRALLQLGLRDGQVVEVWRAHR